MFDFVLSKTPEIKENTFIVWEPCSENHSEVVPGFCRYLLDLGYHVSVLLNPKHYKEGLFCRFKDDENITYNKLSNPKLKISLKKTILKALRAFLLQRQEKFATIFIMNKAMKPSAPTLTKRKFILSNTRQILQLTKESGMKKLLR